MIKEKVTKIVTKCKECEEKKKELSNQITAQKSELTKAKNRNTETNKKLIRCAEEKAQIEQQLAKSNIKVKKCVGRSPTHFSNLET